MSIKTKKRWQKVASVVTSGATILWLSGVSMLMPIAAATYANGTLLKGSSPDIWVVNNNLKTAVRSADVFTSSGYDWTKIKTVSDSALNAVATADLIKTADNPDVYRLEKNFIRKLASIEIFNSYSLDWNKISTVSQPVMDSFSYAPIYQKDSALYWRDSSNVLHQFTTMEVFTGNGYQTRDLIVVNANEFGSFAVGSVISTSPAPAPVTPIAGTGLSVSLASDTPAAASIPSKASGLTYLKFNLTAGTDGAVTVTNLAIKRVGVGSSADFANVYLYEGATRLTSGRSVNSTTNESSFASLNLSIPAGTTRTLSVVVDMKTAGATSGNVNGFQLAAASSITTTATVSGTFPITGNSMTVAGSTGGSLLVQKGATPTNPNVGQVQATATEFKLTGSTEDVLIKRVAIYQAGSISRSNLTNFNLYQGSTLLATTASLSSTDLATFDLSASPYTLPKDITRTFTVKADISASAKPNDTIKFYADQTTDIYAVGATYGFGVQIDIGGTSGTYNGSGTNFTTITVQGGQITVTTAGPAIGNLAIGATDVNFLNFTVNPVVNAQIKILRVEFHSTGTDIDGSNTTVTSAYITSVRVIDTGTNTAVTSSVDLSSFTDIGTNAGVYYSFTDVIDLTAGKARNFKIMANLSTSIQAGTIYATLGKAAATSYVFSSTSIKNTENNQYITDIVPSSAINGQQQTIQTSSLTVAMATTPSSQSYIKGAQNVESAGFIFAAGSGADIKITAVKISGYLSEYSAGALTKNTTGTLYITDMITSVSLWDGSTQLGTSEGFNSSGEATFDGFTMILTKGTSKTLVVKANTNNSADLDTSEDDVGRYTIDITDLSEDVTSVNNDTQADVDATTDGPNGLGVAASVVTVITLRDSGSLTAVAGTSAGTPSAALVIAGSSNLVFTKVKFTSVYEELKITKLQVALSDTADSNDITSVSVEGGGQAAVTQSMGSAGTINFTDLAIVVPKDGSTIVTIKASLPKISEGAVSGDDPILGITGTNFEAVGTGTSNTKLTTASGLTKNGNPMYVKATVPTVAKASGWTPDTLTNGTHDIYRFTVTNTSSSGGYDVSLKAIMFDIAAVDSVYASGNDSVRLDTFRVYRTDNPTAITNVTFYTGNATAAANIVGTNVSGYTSSGYIGTTSTSTFMVFDDGTSGEEIIPAGQSYTYRIEASITGTGVGASSKDYILCRIGDPRQTDQTPKGLTYSASNNPIILETLVGKFIWSDNAVSATYHVSTPQPTGSWAATTRDWTDGYLIQTIATAYATLSQ